MSDALPTSGSRAIRIVAVLGPTASGKSALAMALAERLDGEIVACDSQQVYIGMDIGTAKPTREERRRVPHHGLDLVHPDEPFHAARWAALARAACKSIAGRGRLPIVVGGTGLYYRALTAGLFEAPPPDPALRARHRAIYESEGNEPLRMRLLQVDPEAAAGIAPRDFVRTSRALEVYEQTGSPSPRSAARPPARAISSRRRWCSTPRWTAAGAHRGPGPDDARRRISRRGARASCRRLRRRVEADAGARIPAARGRGRRDDVAGRRDRRNVRATHAYARRQRTWFKKEAASARYSMAPRSKRRWR